jgi:hypothetical protein
LSVTVEVQCNSNFSHANVAVIFYDPSGYRLIDANTAQKGEFVSLQVGQTARVNFLLHELLLKPGKYLVRLWIGRDEEIFDDLEYASTLDVAEGGDTNQHPVIFPGTYLCRFEGSVSVLQPSLTERPDLR